MSRQLRLFPSLLVYLRSDNLELRNAVSELVCHAARFAQSGLLLLPSDVQVRRGVGGSRGDSSGRAAQDCLDADCLQQADYLEWTIRGQTHPRPFAQLFGPDCGGQMGGTGAPAIPRAVGNGVHDCGEPIHAQVAGSKREGDTMRQQAAVKRRALSAAPSCIPGQSPGEKDGDESMAGEAEAEVEARVQLDVVIKSLLQAAHDANLVQTGFVMLANAAAPPPPPLAEGVGLGGRDDAGAHLLEQGEMFMCLSAALQAAHSVLDVASRPLAPRHPGGVEGTWWGGSRHGSDADIAKQAAQAQHVMLLSHALHAVRRVLQATELRATQHSALWPSVPHVHLREEVKSHSKAAEELEATQTAGNTRTLETVQAWLEVVQRVLAWTAHGAGGATGVGVSRSHGQAGWAGRGGGVVSSHRVAALRRSALEVTRDLFLCCLPSAAGQGAVMLTCAGILLGHASHGQDALSSVASLDCLRACVEPQDGRSAGTASSHTCVHEDGEEENVSQVRHHVRGRLVHWWLEQRPMHLRSSHASHDGSSEAGAGGQGEGGGDTAASANQNGESSCRESSRGPDVTALGQIVEVVQCRANDTNWEVRHAAVLLAAALLRCAAGASSVPSSSPSTGQVGSEDESNHSEVTRSMRVKIVQVLYSALEDADPFVRSAVLRAVATVPAVVCGESGGNGSGHAWGSKLASALCDSESMVRRAGVSLVLDILFAHHGAPAAAAHCSDASARPPAALCVPELLGETRAAVGCQPCAGGVEQGHRWSNLLARCLDDVDWEVGLRCSYAHAHTSARAITCVLAAGPDANSAC